MALLHVFSHTLRGYVFILKRTMVDIILRTMLFVGLGCRQTPIIFSWFISATCFHGSLGQTSKRL